MWPLMGYYLINGLPTVNHASSEGLKLSSYVINFISQLFSCIPKLLCLLVS